MVFDINSFYPSNSTNVIMKAIQFARQITQITDEDIILKMQARKTLLFNEEISWVKKDFDVLVGCFDGAEVCELVGSYILLQLSQLFEHDSVRLHKDDGLTILKSLSCPETERVKNLMIMDLKSPLKLICI